MIFPNPVLLLYFLFSPAVALLLFLIRSYWRFWWCWWLLYSSCADQCFKTVALFRGLIILMHLHRSSSVWVVTFATPDSNIPSQFPDIVFCFRWFSWILQSLITAIANTDRLRQFITGDARNTPFPIDGLFYFASESDEYDKWKFGTSIVRCALRYTTRLLACSLSHSLVEWFNVGVLVCLLRSVFGNTSLFTTSFRFWFEDYRGIHIIKFGVYEFLRTLYQVSVTTQL